MLPPLTALSIGCAFTREEAATAEALNFQNSAEIDSFVEEHATLYFKKVFIGEEGGKAEAPVTTKRRKWLAHKYTRARYDDHGKFAGCDKKGFPRESFQGQVLKGMVSHLGGAPFFKIGLNVQWNSTGTTKDAFARRFVDESGEKALEQTEAEPPEPPLTNNQIIILYIAGYLYGALVDGWAEAETL